jgi:glycosyltransferase involved in cell wall biosynthesis
MRSLDVYQGTGAELVVLVITSADLGGAQSHVLTLIKGLRHRYRFSVLVGGSGPLVDQLTEIGIAVRFVPKLARTLNPLSIFASVAWLIGHFKATRPVLVHAHSSNAGLATRLAAYMANVPCVFTAHGWGFKQGVPMIRRVLVYLAEAIATPLTSRIVCVSSSDLALAKRLLPGHRFVHVANGINDSMRRAQPLDEPPTIVMIARFQEPKDQELLLRAFAELKATAFLTFVGDGPNLARVRALAAALGAMSKVFWRGARSLL